MRVEFHAFTFEDRCDFAYTQALQKMATALEDNHDLWWHDSRRLEIWGPQQSEELANGQFQVVQARRKVSLHFVYDSCHGGSVEANRALAREHVGRVLVTLKSEGLIAEIPTLDEIVGARRKDTEEESESEIDQIMGLPHPLFRANFHDPMYSEVESDFGPFGTDEAAMMLEEWVELIRTSPDSITVRNLVAPLMEDSDQLGHLTAVDSATLADEPGAIDLCSFVVAAAFTILRVTGQCDREGVHLLEAALRVQRLYYGHIPALETMLRDVQHFLGRLE